VLKTVLLSGAAVSLLLAAHTSANAQPAAPAADAPVEKVTVTARKRSEQARDIPGGVSVITGEEQRNLTVDGTQDYARQMPSTTLVNSGPEYLNDISIRGSGSGRLGFSETATGIYKDGNYSAGGGFGGRALNRMDLFDIERIEVLRGPQGALYGRNSVGGAINVVARKPSDVFEVFGEIGYQDTERWIGKAIVNLPLVDDLWLFRAGGFHDEQNDGHHVNLTTGNAVDQQSFTGARATSDWRPDADTLFRLVYEYYDSATPAFGNVGFRAAAPANVGGFAIDPEPYTRNFMNREGFAEVSENSVFFTAEHTTSFGQFTVKLNHRKRDALRFHEDLDHFAGIASYLVNGQTVDLISGQGEDFARTGVEALLSSDDEGRWHWLLGVEGQFYEDEVITDPRVCPAYATAGAPTFIPGCTPGGAIVANPDAGPAGQALTAGQTGAALSTGRQNLNHDDFIEELESFSLFGLIEHDLSDAFTAGLEARIQRDKKDFAFRRYSVDPIVYFGPGAAPAGRLTEILVNGNPAQFCPPSISGTADCVADGGISRDTLMIPASEEWTQFTPAATLKWDLNATDTAYLRFATGYRPGGFNVSMPNGLPRSDLQALIGYDPEYAYSYEVGWKGRLFDAITIDAAVFYNLTNESQQVSAPSSLARGFVLQNAGDTEVYGAEIEARTRFDVGPGNLVLTAVYSTIDGSFLEGATVLLDGNGDGIPDVLDISGNQVPRLRDYQIALNATYTVPLGGELRGLAAVGFQSADGGFETPDNTRTYEGYDLLDARLALLTEHWRLSLFGKNLTDERFRIQTVALNDYHNEPRVIGLELSYQK
jgi:outer membrane receptor protein involved in Fe transport